MSVCHSLDCAHMTLLPSCGDNFVNDTERKLQKDSFCPRERASQKNSSYSLKTATDYLTLICLSILNFPTIKINSEAFSDNNSWYESPVGIPRPKK